MRRRSVVTAEIRKLLSVDPGDPHVGVALWVRSGPRDRWRCTRAREMLPEAYADSVVKIIDGCQVDAVAMEAFRLGGGQEAMYQKGSSFGMVELIGLTRHHCRWVGMPFVLVPRDQRSNTLKRMKTVKWGFPRGAGGHVWDAIAVGARVLGWSAADHVEGDGCPVSE